MVGGGGGSGGGGGRGQREWWGGGGGYKNSNKRVGDGRRGSQREGWRRSDKGHIKTVSGYR